MSSTTSLGSPNRLAALEDLLADPEGPFTEAAAAELDRAEAFPARACALLDEFGLPAHYVPARFGGALTDFVDLLTLLRRIARRDLTVAVAHAKTFLGAASVWVAGTPEQAARLGADVIDGAVVSWGLSERGHGSDLLASELRANRDAGGWRLDGEKHLINNATRGSHICVLARTGEPGDPRGLSLFLVDKRTLAADQVEYLPKVRTHGIRGADISGLRLHGAPVAADALVGAEGGGLETVLKALQLTRTLCAGLSLGVGDHAVRLAAAFAAERSLYGSTLIELPQVRRKLGAAAAGVLVGEAVTLLGGRSAQALPSEMSVLSLLTKAFVPSLIGDVVAELSELLGARGFMTDVYAEGAFPKLDRDHRIMELFDGSTLVNRVALIGQFPRLARVWRAHRADEAGLTTAATLSAALPEFDPSGLRLTSLTGCSAVAALPAAAARLPKALAPLGAALVAQAEALHQELDEYTPVTRNVPASAFRLAERYELVYAGAACVLVWLANHGDRATDPLWHDGLWLRAGLVRVLGALGAEVPAAAAGAGDALAVRLAGLSPDEPFTLSTESTA